VDDNGNEKLITTMMNNQFLQSGFINLCLAGVLAVFATYFLMNEVKQMVDGGAIDYLS